MLARIALLLALEIVLTRFCSITTPIVRIGFGFLPIAMVAVLYGPVAAGLTYAAGDFLGAILFPVGAFFPGFTLTALLVGIVYGVCFYQKRLSWPRLLVAAGIVSVLLHLGLDTYWLHMLLEKGYWAMLPTRIIKCVLMIPVQAVMIRLCAGRVQVWLGEAAT